MFEDVVAFIYGDMELKWAKCAHYKYILSSDQAPMWRPWTFLMFGGPCMDWTWLWLIEALTQDLWGCFLVSGTATMFGWVKRVSWHIHMNAKSRGFPSRTLRCNEVIGVSHFTCWCSIGVCIATHLTLCGSLLLQKRLCSTREQWRSRDCLHSISQSNCILCAGAINET